MLEFIINIDKGLFYLMNQVWINPFLDKFMPFITLQEHWNISYIILFVLLFWKGGRNGRIAATVLLLTIIISDFTSSTLIKSLVGRPRPCREPESVRLLISCGPGFSFPSSHAVNNFAMAFVLSYFFRTYRWVLFILAAMIAWSRVYVGVHFPVDILSGAFLGSAIAFLMIYLYKFLSLKFPAFRTKH
jgi:undecaprenyl-diphosphatase